MAEPTLLVEIADRIGLLVLNRPHSLNALSSELRTLLIDALASLDANPDVSVAILTGNGRSFCAGLDLKEIAGSQSDVTANVRRQNVVAAMSSFSKPLIGAINGLAVTGGLEISLACDLLVAAESAQFADTHVRVGINPGWGLSQRLSRAILTTARSLAAEIAVSECARLVRMKSVIDEGFAMPLAQALHMEAERALALNSAVTARAVATGHDAARARARGTL
jgi:enoyl-CoA hydratase